MVFQSDYKLATSWNNAAGLSTLEGTIPSSDLAFHVFRVFGGHTGGIRNISLLGTVVYTGYETVTWSFGTEGYITPGQDYYLRNTYCGGASGVSAKVTVRTTTTRITTFANYNAIMYLPEHSELTRDVSGRFRDYRITFSLRGSAS